jgi:prepilin-type N-terminal cleavage/methylation domain-containing protein
MKRVVVRLGQRGMTVIEIMVGLGLMAIAVMGLNSLAISAIRNNLSARLIDQGTLLAEQKFEQIQRNGYAAAVPGTTTENNLDGQGNPGGGYQRVTTIAQGVFGTTRNVTVTITWADYGLRQASFVTEIVQ